VTFQKAEEEEEFARNRKPYDLELRAYPMTSEEANGFR
jgi:hypothetical protein